MSPDSRYLRRASVVKRTIASQSILIPMGPAGANLQTVFTLNDTADAVWDLLSEKRTIDEIVEALRPDYDAGLELIRQDVEELLQDLVSRGLVTDTVVHE